MQLGREVGLGPSDILLDGDPVLPSQKEGRATVFGPCLLAGWIKRALGMEVGLGPGHIVLDGDQLSSSPPQRGHTPQFSTIKHKVAWAEAYLHTKSHLHASSRLATIEMGR